MGKPGLTVKLGALELKNPLIASSGTFGYGTEYAGLARAEAFGAVVLKGVTMRPREGNPPPRIFETSCGLLNSIGLQNCGIDAFISEKLPYLSNIDTLIIANLTGTEEEIIRMLHMLEGTSVAAAEINLSCPNLKGQIISASPALTADFVLSVRKNAKIPLIVKLSPQVSDITETARACEDSGADILSLVNTFPAMAIDIENMKPALANVTGGLSGPAIKPIALKLVWDACRSVNIPVVGMGGIMTSSDVIEFILAGAHAVSLGTGIFSCPETISDFNAEIENYLASKGFKSISDIRGALDVS